MNILEAASIIKDSAEKIAQEKGISEEEAYYEAILIYTDVYEKEKEEGKYMAYLISLNKYL